MSGDPPSGQGRAGAQARTRGDNGPVTDTRLRSLAVAAVAAVAAAVFLGALALVAAAPGGTVAGWERDAFAAVNRLPDVLHAPVWAVMQAGSLLAVPVTATAAFWWDRRRLAARLLVGGGVAYVGALLVKTLVGRGRPEGLLEEVLVRGDPQSGLGFVSGHTAVAVALATAATPHLGRGGRIVVWSLAAIVGLGRIYVGAHLPLDVVGGAALGVLAGLVALAVIGSGRDRSAPRPQR